MMYGGSNKMWFSSPSLSSNFNKQLNFFYDDQESVEGDNVATVPTITVEKAEDTPPAEDTNQDTSSEVKASPKPAGK